MLESNFNTPEICQTKKVDMQGFQFPAMLLVPSVFVLWCGVSDNLKTPFPARLLCWAPCWAFPRLSVGPQIGFQSYSSDLAWPAVNQRAGFSAGVFEAALSCTFCSHSCRSKLQITATAGASGDGLPV